MLRVRPVARVLAGGGTAALLALAAAPVLAAPPAPSSLRSAVAPATVLTGAAAVVSGAVSPSVAGSPVRLERLVANRWQPLARQATGKGGSYSFTVRALGRAGTWSLRVTRAASAGVGAVTGRTLSLRLTATAYTVSSSAVTKVNAGDPVVINGTVLPRATGQVSLQALRLGRWTTLATARLSGSAYSFSEVLPPGTYALRVLKAFGAATATGESAPLSVTVFAPAGTVTRPEGSARLTISSPDDAVLALPASRLVFSTVHSAATAPKDIVFANAGAHDATVSGLAIQGGDATSFALAPGQPTSVTVPAGGSATVSVVFHPTATSGCPTAARPYSVSQPVRTAALVYSTSDVGLPGGSLVVAGINSCTWGGASEPVLDQVLSALGYTTVVATPGGERRFLGQAVRLPGTDEIAAPYFRAADPSAPVSLVPLAHYSSPDVVPYHATGWYAQGATLGADGVCNEACHLLWDFAAEATTSTYTQNQRLLPTPVGTETFSPPGAFGLFAGEYRDVNFSDDSLNVAHSTAVGSPDLVPTTYLHDLRVYPAYGPGHRVIAGTYLIAVDVSRAPALKNGDYQDLVLLLRNAVPVG